MKKLWLIFLILIIVFPCIYITLLSLFKYYKYPLLFPDNFTLDFWKETILNNSLFLEGLLSSLVIGISTGALTTALGIITAKAIENYNFFGKKFIQKFFSIPLFIPSIVLFISLHQMMLKLNLVNNYISVITAHIIIALPYSINIFISFFKGISLDFEHVAKTLGCGSIFYFKNILLKLIMPGIFLSFSISFLISFSEYFSVFLIGGGNIISYSMIMYPYITNYEIGDGATLGVVFISINILIFTIADFITRKNLKITNYLYQ